MQRIQVTDPLADRAPSLRPTSRPIAVSAGARPPPRLQDNGIMALADALSEWQPGLRQMIADKAAQEQDAALTAGELKAAELDAKGRMSALNTGLKEYADKGELPAGQLPSFQQGFSRRTGRELALAELAPALESRLADASKLDGRADPETVIADTLKEFRQRLPADNLYAQQGFDQQAQRLADNFRQKTAATYAQNYEEAGRLGIANEASDIFARLALSGPDEQDGIRGELRTFFDGVKADELPKHQVAPFILERAVAPLVRDLASRGQFDDAEQVLHEAESFDVTGQGGLLGSMAAAHGTFATLRAQIDDFRRTADDPSEVFAKKSRASQLSGVSAAKVAVVELADKPLDFATRETLVSEFRAKNPTDKEAVFAFQDFLDDHLKNGARPDDAEAVLSLNRLIATVSVDKLQEARQMLSAFSAARQISAATELQLEEQIKHNENLVGLFNPTFRDAAGRNIYATTDPKDPQTRVAAFASREAYDSLTPEQQREHEARTLDYFDSTLQELIRAKGDPVVAKQEMGKLLDEATNRAIKFADTVTDTFQVQNERRGRELQVEAARVRQYRAESTQRRRPFQLLYAFRTGSEAAAKTAVPGEAGGAFLTGFFDALHGPKPSTLAEAAAAFNKERGDAANPALNNTPALKDYYSLTTARTGAQYAYLKSAVGFKPDEIIKKVTAEGVEIDPAQIDYRQVPVFESLAQLETEWNYGRPAAGGLFAQVGDLIDPTDTVTSQDFYAHQRALLSAAKK